MELRLVRKYFSENCTIGELYVNGAYTCDVLEDVDRGLDSKMSLEEISKLKIKAQTAIPYGTYLIANTFSPRFKTYLPLLLNVPGYQGIRIHPGNTAKDTEGCLLPGLLTWELDKVTDSRKHFKIVFDAIKKVEKKEKITITIEKYENTEETGDTV